MIRMNINIQVLPGLKMLYSLVRRYLYRELCDEWYTGVMNVVLT